MQAYPISVTTRQAGRILLDQRDLLPSENILLNSMQADRRNVGRNRNFPFPSIASLPPEPPTPSPLLRPPSMPTKCSSGSAPFRRRIYSDASVVLSRTHRRLRLSTIPISLRCIGLASFAAGSQNDLLRGPDRSWIGSRPRTGNRSSRPEAGKPLRHQGRPDQDSGFRACEVDAAPAGAGRQRADDDPAAPIPAWLWAPPDTCLPSRFAGKRSIIGPTSSLSARFSMRC